MATAMSHDLSQIYIQILGVRITRSNYNMYVSISYNHTRHGRQMYQKQDWLDEKLNKATY